MGQAEWIESTGHCPWVKVQLEKRIEKPCDKDWHIGYYLVEMV